MAYLKKEPDRIFDDLSDECDSVKAAGGLLMEHIEIRDCMIQELRDKVEDLEGQLEDALKARRV